MSLSRGALCAVGIVLLLGSAGPAWSAPSAAEGRKLYQRYCGSCHGATGAGDGPVATLLKVPPTNLQRLGERYGRPLPDSVLAYIDGRKPVAAHGDREMPVWGRSFIFLLEEGQSPPDENEVREILQSILLYLDSIQPGGANAPRTSP